MAVWKEGNLQAGLVSKALILPAIANLAPDGQVRFHYTHTTAHRPCSNKRYSGTCQMPRVHESSRVIDRRAQTNLNRAASCFGLI